MERVRDGRFHGTQEAVECCHGENVGSQRCLAHRKRGYKAMHEEFFLNSWLCEDVEEGKAKMKEGKKKLKKRRVKVGRERWRVKRRKR